MRRFFNERNLLLIVSLIIATTLWYYVTAGRSPRAAPTTSRTVAVVPQIVGEPAHGYMVLGVRVSPQTVTASGDPDRLAQLRTLATEPVNIRGAIRDVVQEVAVAAPPDVNVSARVQVRVQVAPAVAVTVVRGIRVDVRNAPAGMVTVVDPQTVSVQVQGPVALISRLRAEDFVARIDGSDLSEGDQRARIAIEAPPQIEVRAVIPPTVTVTVRKGG